MALSKNRKKFEEHQKKLIEANEKKGNGSNFNNPNQIKFEAGKTYRLRLLFDESEKRKDSPFVNKYVHGGKNAQGKWRTVTCPTTHGPNNYDKCPTCTHNNKLYNSWKETGMERDKELYDMYKRKFNGFALAFVVNDPTTTDNNGHAKYFRFSIRQKRWLEREIYGIVSSFVNDEEKEKESSDFDTVGFDAFDLDNGYDLIISVTKQGEYLNYDYKFARKATAIDCDIETLEAEIVEIDFDKNITSSSDEDLQNFYRTVVISSDEVDDIPTSENGGIESEDIPVDEIEDVNEKDNSDDSSEDSSDDDDVLGDDDIKSILDEINAEA